MIQDGQLIPLIMVISGRNRPGLIEASPNRGRLALSR